MRSRLKSNIKKQSLHILLLIVAIILILAIYGTQILVGFGIILDKIRGSKNEDMQEQSVSYIAPPQLDTLPAATKENEINISGSSVSHDVLIELYINGKLSKKLNTDKNGLFTFKNLRLEEGVNNIKARSISRSGIKSDYSNISTIKYLNKNPELEIKEPTDGQKFKKDQSPIKVSGKTDPGSKVTVNDFWTIINDDGDFYYNFSLKDGDNKLKIISTDEAGNTTSKEINIRVE